MMEQQSYSDVPLSEPIADNTVQTAQLSFQEIKFTAPNTGSTTNTGNTTNIKPPVVSQVPSASFGDLDDLESQSLLSPSNSASNSGDGSQIDSNARFYHISYYRHLFDVDTKLVCNRLLRALAPVGPPFYADEAKPDLYGPFWVTTTLIFLMGATGNLANYMRHEGANWQSNFHKVTYGASLFYGVLGLVPIAVWYLLDKVKQNKPLVEIMSLYGYSLFVFIPSCVLCVIPLALIRWLSILISLVFSLTFLFRNVWNYHALTPQTQKDGFALLCLMCFVHGIIAVSMEFYFFNY